MPELLTKPILTEAMSMPLLQHPSVPLDEDIIAELELELGDEERLLPTDLLNDDEDFESSSSSNSNSKIPLRKTWSWTPEQLPFDYHQDNDQNQEKQSENCENSVKSNKKPELRQLEKAIKSLSIDPNMSISRKF